MVWASQGLYFLVDITHLYFHLGEDERKFTSPYKFKNERKERKRDEGACLHREMHLANPLQRLEEPILRINLYSNAGCLRVKL